MKGCMKLVILGTCELIIQKMEKIFLKFRFQNLNLWIRMDIKKYIFMQKKEREQNPKPNLFIRLFWKHSLVNVQKEWRQVIWMVIVQIINFIILFGKAMQITIIEKRSMAPIIMKLHKLFSILWKQEKKYLHFRV